MIGRVLHFTLCFAGTILSIYALHVELTKAADQSYTALCDINEHMSCSKVFLSKYGTGFGIVQPILGKDSIFNVPNTVYGIIFYAIMIILGLIPKWKTGIHLRVVLSFMAGGGCVYLAYILFFILRDFCLVCFGTYIVNFGLLFISLTDLSLFQEESSKPKRE